MILSALATIVHEWDKNGRPKAKPQTRFERWSVIVGGVMENVKLGCPGLPSESAFNVGGDLKEKALYELFRIASARGSVWLKLNDLYQIVEDEAHPDDYDAQPNEDLAWFGHLRGDHKDARSNQTKFSLVIRQAKGRVIAKVRLEIDESDKSSRRHRFRFVNL